MTTALGLAPPIVLAGATGPAGEDLTPQVTVTPASVGVGLGLDIHTPGGALQQNPGGTVAPLETVLALHAGWASFLPAGKAVLANGIPLSSGPVARDCWALEPGLEEGRLRALLPVGIPVPTLWLLEGVDATDVSAVLQSWLDRTAPGIAPQPEACHLHTDAADRLGTPEETWRARMLAGTWSELVPAQALLGPAAAPDGTTPTLTVRAFAQDGTELPAAAIIESFGRVDAEHLAAHPVVTGCGSLAATLPVTIYLQLDVWDVDLAPKGQERPLQPVVVRLVPDDGGAPIPEPTATRVDPYTRLEIDQGELRDRSFHVEADLAPDTRIRLERGAERFWPPDGQAPTWSSAGWQVRDGTMLGSWTGFAGVQLGTATEPLRFWVGTKVSLIVEFEQLQRDPIGGSLGVLELRRVAPGHQLGLYTSRGDTTFVDRFTTDADGEVSAVSFAVRAGMPLGAAVRRRLDGDGPELWAHEEPFHVFVTRRGSDGWEDRPRLLTGGLYFWSQDAREQLFYTAFRSGELSASLRVDSDLDDLLPGANVLQRNTDHAAAFHALKYARLTHETFALLSDGADAVPLRHDVHLVLEEGVPHALFAEPVDDDGVVQPLADYTTYTFLPSSYWFHHPAVVHEFAHGIAFRLADRVTDPARRDVFLDGVGAYLARFRDEFEQADSWHSTDLRTNGGFALTEGLAEIVACFLGVYRPLRSPTGGTAGPGIPFKEVYGVREPQLGEHRSTSLLLQERCGRNIEGVFAQALHMFVNRITSLASLFQTADDTAVGCRRPQSYLDEWLTREDADLDGLRRVITWVIVGPIRDVVGGPSFLWSGQWPQGSGAHYPTTYDFLRAIESTAPAPPPSEKESFAYLHDQILIPWNLEQDDGDPALGPDWEP